MPVPTGTINPITGHVNEDDVALFRAIGPDQADPPSTQGRRSELPRIPFGWVRPPLGGLPVLRLRQKCLVSAVMTTQAESRISHGLLVVRSWLTDQSADVALVSIVFVITCTYDD
jgi:hypothetical protein